MKSKKQSDKRIKKQISKKQTSNKTYNLDKYLGKVIFVNLPNNKRKRYRWIVRKTENNRYVARRPKIGVLARDLNLKRESDYNKEVLLPKGTYYCLVPFC
tara:strand:+ start:227 stop:526 length:300 start_codon:yes stop_codon:yes gene_type:complete